MRLTYQKAWDTLTYVMAREFQDLDNLRTIAAAVGQADPDAARAAARAHIELGRQAVDAVFSAV